MKQVITLFLLVWLISGATFAQPINYMQDYAAAKANLKAGNYNLALSSFAKLLNADPAHAVSPYTSYFYGVSAYSLNQKEKAKDMFLQITRKYSAWDKLPDTYFWLSKISFELLSPNQGLFYAGKISGDPSLLNLAAELKKYQLAQLDILTLKLLIEEHQQEEVIAQLLAEKMAALAYGQRDNNYLYNIINQYNLDSASLGLGVPTDKYKEKYKVAVMLPLFAERLWQSGVYLQKSLAVDLYEGIKLALAEFDSTKFVIKVFDTKKDSLTTSNILNSGELMEFDAIIGPLYPKPLALVADYAIKNKINFVNPVSTNPEIVRHNPYGFLLRTSAESRGEFIGNFTIENIDKKACAIYYGPSSADSLTAYNYVARIEKDSFYVAIRQKTSTNKAREIFDLLTSSVEVIDSVELKRMWLDGERVMVLPKKDSLLLKVDSLGHIFIASDNKAIASEVMAAVTSRGDSTQLIGVGDWFSTANASLNLMETMGVWLAMQEYENMLHPHNISISEKYRAIYHQKPSKYVFYGYYATKFLGESLLKYGIYFQNGYRANGNFSDMFNYAHSQDNKSLMLYKLEEGIPEIVNKH